MATMYYRPFTSEPQQDGGLPPLDAVENIIPEYQYIFADQPRKPGGGPRAAGGASGTSGAGADDPAALAAEVEQSAQKLLEWQTQELERYRQAVKIMGQEILSLRQQIRELENHNSSMRVKLSGYSDVAKLIIETEDVSELSQSELTDKYTTLKRKLNEQTTEMREYKTMVKDLRSQLAKKESQERELAKLSVAHEGQQDLLQRLQERVTKVRKLEDVCRKQEKVIEKMEKQLEASSYAHTHQTSNRDNSLTGINAALAEENRRLHLEAQEIMSNPTRVPQYDQDSEKLSLLEKLNRAEGRIASLERQLVENARNWAREKSELQLRVMETGAPRPLSPQYRSLPAIGSKPNTPEGLRDDALSRSTPKKGYSTKGKSPALRH